MNPEPLVSVVTPAYNASSTIGECIRSVQQQSYQNWEHLIVDDGSKDHTKQIVESFALKDNRIRFLQSPKNVGPAQVRQIALDNAKGRFLAFLDSDDLWLPEKLKKQINFMLENDATLSFTQYRRINFDGSNPGRLIDIPETVTYQQLLKHNVIACLTAVIDLKKSGPVKMTDEGYDDFILWLSVLKKGHTAYGLREDLARYRISPGSVSRNRFRAALWVWNIYRNVEKLPLVTSGYNFVNYAKNTLLKHSRH